MCPLGANIGTAFRDPAVSCGEFDGPSDEGLAVPSGLNDRFRGLPRGMRAFDLNGCGCREVLQERVPRFLVSEKTELEVQKLVRLNLFIKPSRYNYVRLFAVVLDCIVDSFGSLIVHRICASNYFHISLYWLTHAHKNAIVVLNTPMHDVPRRSLYSSEQSVLNRVVLPEMSMVNVAKNLETLDGSDPVTMIWDRKRQHGLYGQKGN